MNLAYLFLLASTFRIPDGFEVTLVADHTVVNDTHCMTINPRGQLVVSGRGYVRLLDGERIVNFTGAPKDGAMGLCWDGNDLYVVGDGGLKVWRGADPTKPPELLYKLRTGSEHLAHAVCRGPDGWLYVLVGDSTGITKADINSPDSPVQDPIAGCVLRFSPDFKRREVYAHGFRNAYAMDFGPDGALYTFDSDNERCVSLPWYEPCRFYRVEPGGHHGWLGPKLAATWRMPPHFVDVVPPRATLGRGSPTGVVVYKHSSFPAKYRGGAFLADWTFGVIHFVSREGKPEVFLRSIGTDGFAPTALAVHPETGDLYVSIGGRGTRGGVYRIRHTQGVNAIDRAEVARLQPKALARFPANAQSEDRLQRQRAARQIPADAPLPETPLARSTHYLAHPSADAIDLVTDTSLPPQLRLDGVRLVQRWLGGPPDPRQRGTVWEGYSRTGSQPIPQRVREGLRKAFSCDDALLDGEIARTLALIEDDDPATARTIAAKLPSKKPTDAVHYLIVLARFRALPADLTRPIAESLLTLDDRLDALKQKRDNNWPPRLAELHARLALLLPKLNATLLADKRFGRAEHALFTRAKGFDRATAASRFLANPDLVWNAELVRLMGALPAEKGLAVARELWGRAGVDDELLPLLARHGSAADRPKLLSGLSSARLNLVETVLTALERMEPDRSETLPLLRALQQLPPEKETAALYKRMFMRLEKVTGHSEKDTDSWMAWARKQFPEQAPSLANLDGVDADTWNQRLAKIDWTRGDAQRGAAVFQKAQCAACHSGAAALGPDLAGVAKRFSRRDLLTAIVQPSKDVSPRYRTVRVVTAKGTVHQGIIIYEAADGMILQTGPAETIRIPGRPSKTPTPRSLMPAGLLDSLRDEEIADLLAHLASR
jgi:putative heme-binding domain-containing protein